MKKKRKRKRKCYTGLTMIIGKCIVDGLTLNYITGHECGCVVVALQQAVSQIALDLQTKEITSEFLFELCRVRGVKLDAEPEKWIDQGQAHLSAHGLLQVEPVLQKVVLNWQENNQLAPFRTLVSLFLVYTETTHDRRTFAPCMS